MSQLIWRRSVAGALVGAALFGGLGSPWHQRRGHSRLTSAAQSQPAMTADQALALLRVNTISVRAEGSSPN